MGGEKGGRNLIMKVMKRGIKEEYDSKNDDMKWNERGEKYRPISDRNIT
jgi:hypothetical protein